MCWPRWSNPRIAPPSPAAGRPVLVVLNKADLIATTAPGRHPDGPTAAARARCAQLSARAGFPVEPLVGVLAVAALDDTSWRGLLALAGGQPVDDAVRGRLMDTLDAFGIRQATAAIRRGAGRGDVEALLRGVSGIDAVTDKLVVLGAQPRYQRMLAAVAQLETMAVADPRISDFLVERRHRGGPDDGRISTQSRRSVSAWITATRPQRTSVARCTGRADADKTVTGGGRACRADIVRGSLRLWSKVGGSV